MTLTPRNRDRLLREWVDYCKAHPEEQLTMPEFLEHYDQYHEGMVKPINPDTGEVPR
jgi:hypothetical protein